MDIDAEDDKDAATYRWEMGMQRSWDQVQEDEYGNLTAESSQHGK